MQIRCKYALWLVWWSDIAAETPLPGVQNAITPLESVCPHLSRAALSLAVVGGADCWLHRRPSCWVSAPAPAPGLPGRSGPALPASSVSTGPGQRALTSSSIWMGSPAPLCPARELGATEPVEPSSRGDVRLFCSQPRAFCFPHSLGKTCPLVFPFLKFPLGADSQGPCQLGFTPGLGYGLHGA